MARPYVSIMLPCFNAGETLRFALASLLAQTFTDWECVCLDDGSTDDTFSILTEIAKRDSRFRVERFPENRGRGAARQRILELATGELLAFLDADDWMYPDRLRHEIGWLESDVHIVAVSVCTAVTDGHDRLVGLMKPRSTKPLPEVTIFDRMAPPPLLFPTSMMRTALARETGFNPAFKRSQDSDFLVRSLFGKHYALSSAVLYAYSKSGASLERTLEGYRFRMRTHLGNWRSHPIEVSRTVVKTSAKMLAYRAAGALGLEQRLIDRRRDPADDETARGFEVALSAVRQVHQSWFG
jgi:glycosyltransferase involved in cell wall biosynthesis